MSVARRGALATLGGAFVALARGANASPPGDLPPAMRRTAGERERWLAQHEAYVARAGRGSIDAVFLGDSLTFGWLVAGRSVYDEVYAPRRVVAFGIGGDRTTDLLWRLRHGELTGAAPRVVTILIGTNDLAAGAGAKAVTGGIVDCVETVRVAVSSASVLLLGLLPRGPGGANGALRQELGAVNEAIARLGNGRSVRFLDLGSAFVRPDGFVDRALFEPDLVHLSASGYAAWSRAMAPSFDAMLSNKI